MSKKLIEEIYAVMNTHGIVNTVDEGYPYCKPTKFIHEDKYNTLKAENEKLREALELSVQIDKTNWHMAGDGEALKAIKGFKRKRDKALKG